MRTVVLAAAAAAVLAGCGSDGLSPFEQGALLDPLETARAAAADGDADAARRALARVTERVRALRAQDGITAASAQRLLVAVTAAREDLAAPGPAATPTPEPTSTPLPQATTVVPTPTPTPTVAPPAGKPEKPEKPEKLEKPKKAKGKP